MKKFLGLQGLQEVIDKIKAMISSLNTIIDSHISNTSNPHKITKDQIGLNNVENKSSATIRSELTKENVTTALGYTPPTQDTKYTHPSYTAKTNGLYKVTVDSTGHVSEVASVTKSDITALGIPGQDTNTTYSVATQSTNGLLSSTDKTKLDGIATGANKYVLPTASSSTLGGVKTTSSVTSASGYTACPIISGVPYYKDTNTTYSLGSFGVTATAAELNYTDGVTGNIQTQLNGKAASSHTHTKSQISDFPSSLPANGGTATNANNIVQTVVDASGYTNWRTLIWGASNSGTEGFSPATVTGGVYTCKTITCQPSSGTIKANVFKGSLSGNASSASSVPWSGVSGKPSSMPASDVYAWAKASSKPSYSWSEIGSKPSTFTPSSHTHTLSQVSGVTPSAIGAAPASHSHSYLPLSGGTLTGRLNAPTVGGSWVSGMTLTNATLGISTKNSSGSYHPIIACKTYNSHVWNLGTITDTVGFYGFKNGRTENSTDWSFAINVISGAVTSSGSITAPTFYGNLSGNASSASSVAWGNVSGKPTTFTPAAHNQAWSTITGKPSTFAPSAHSHAVAQSSEPSGQNNGDLWFKSI